MCIRDRPYSEVKATAKSIATYCWKKDAYCYQEFIDRQKRKGKLGREKGGVSRSLKYESLRVQAQLLYKDGVKQKDIAEILGITVRSIRNWTKNK